MKKCYDELISYIVSAGKRLARSQKRGVTKKYSNQEDIRIEKEIKDIIHSHYPTHTFFSEEKYDSFPDDDHVWVADPISGTGTFIKGLPHYGIVLAYVKKGIVRFGVVYDPSVDELFVAYKGKGAFLNGKNISISSKANVVFNLSSGWNDENYSQKIQQELKSFNSFRNKHSHAVNVCHVACGRVGGIIALGKDTFPYYASSLILREAGGKFTNKKGHAKFEHSDRVFIGGNLKQYQKLRKIL